MSNTTIAKNAIFLYVRTIVTILISLFTSRVLLRTLGVDDFGLYNLIGGIVAIFTSLRIFLSNAIQRFINYERGRGNEDRVGLVFNIGIYIHRWAAVIFFILAEITGFLLIRELNIEPDRLTAAYITFQFSVLTTIASILTVPYDALIIANERMDFFATLCIIESVLKLCIVYVISGVSFDTLVFYSSLLFAVSVVIRSVKVIYCKRIFPESRPQKCRDRNLMKRMMTFAGWNICGNMGYSLTHEGVNFVLNLFGGVAVNAAKGITYQIISAINTLIGNVSIAFKPQINTVYGEGDRSRFYDLLTYNGKILFSSYIIIAVPLFVFVPQVLTLWLETVPMYTVEFVRAIIFYGLIRTIHQFLDVYFDSIGEMKYYQICELSFRILNIPIAYILLYVGLPFWCVFVAMGMTELMNLICIAVIASKLYDFNYIRYVKGIIIPYVEFIICGICAICVCDRLIENMDSIWGMTGALWSVVVAMIMCAYFIVLDKAERRIIKNKMCGKLRITKEN